MKKIKLTQSQLEQIKKEIDNNLELRCINVETTISLEELKNGDQYIKVESSNFQTVPAIHKNLHITNFGGSVVEDEERPNFYKVWLPISVRYDGNGKDLFDMELFVEKDYNVHVGKITHHLR